MMQSTEHDSEFLGIEETARLFPHLTPSALYSQRHRGEAPGCLAVKVGKRLVWRRSDLDEWWETQRPVAIG